MTEAIEPSSIAQPLTLTGSEKRARAYRIAFFAVTIILSVAALLAGFHGAGTSYFAISGVFGFLSLYAVYIIYSSEKSISITKKRYLEVKDKPLPNPENGEEVDSKEATRIAKVYKQAAYIFNGVDTEKGKAWHNLAFPFLAERKWLDETYIGFPLYHRNTER